MGETRLDAGFEVWRGSLVLLVVSGEFFFAKARSRVRASLPAPNPGTPEALRLRGFVFFGPEFFEQALFRRAGFAGNIGSYAIVRPWRPA